MISCASTCVLYIYLGNEAMVQMLLKHGADVNKGDGRNQFTPLRAANAGRMCDFGDRACGRYRCMHVATSTLLEYWATTVM